MNKLFTKIATAFVGIAMAIGVGVAIENNSSFKADATAVSGSGTGSLTFSSDHKVASNNDTISDTAGATFTFTTDSGYIELDGGSIHTGSGKKSCSHQTWTTGDYSSVTITSVVVNAKMASGSGVSASVTINGNSVGSSQSITASAANYTFTNSSSYKGGNLVVKLSRSSASQKAIYCYSITVNYESESPTPTTYTVTYAANDGTGTTTADPNSPYNSGATVTVLENEFEREGYDFVDFTTNADGTGTHYDKDDTFTINANTTLYAQWEEHIDGLKFDLTSNPGGWPTDNETTLTDYDYTLGGIDYTFSLKNIKCNSGYLMCTYTAVLGLPALVGKKLTRVVINNSNGCSTSTVVGISSTSSSFTKVTGGDQQTWSTTGSKYSYTLSNTQGNTQYYVYVTTKNAQITYITLAYEDLPKCTVTFTVNTPEYGTVSKDSITDVPNGSTITSSNNTVTINGTTVTATPSSSTAQYNYSFDNWTNATGTVTSNITITANFSITTRTYTVLWKNYDGTVLETDNNVQYGATPSYDGATPTRASTAEYSYSFSGWDPSPTSVVGDAIYTAQYNSTKNTYDVTGSISHGSLSVPGKIEYGGSLNVTIVSDTNYGVPENQSDISATGATISSYTVTDETHGVVLLSNATGDVTVTASCVPLVDVFTVTYDPNDGVSPKTTEEVIENGHPTFPTPTRSGYNLKGWQVDGEGTVYTDPNKYTVTTDVEFVAKWAAVYTVTFNSSGGSLSPESIPVEDGLTFTFPSPGTKEHYSFLGWSSDGGTTKYDDGDTSPAVTNNITYTAQWNADPQYDVTYTAGSGGTGTFVDENQWSGSYTLKQFANLTTISAQEGYQFKNYKVDGVDKNPGDVVSLSDNLSISVVFEELPTPVSFVFSEHYSENTVLDGVKISIDSFINITFSKGGTATQYYTNGEAVRWYGGGGLVVNGGGATILEIAISYTRHDNYVTADAGDYEDVTTVPGDGVWTGEETSVTFTQGGTSGHNRISAISVTYSTSGVTTYTITYNGNGATSGSMSPVTATSPTVEACAFEKEGYSFARWNTQEDGEGDDYAVGTPVSEDITLYAIWQEIIEPIGADVIMEPSSNASSATVVVGTTNKSALKCGTGSKQGEMKLTLKVANITKVKIYIACWDNESENAHLDVSIDNGATVSPSTLDLVKDSSLTGSKTTFELAGTETTYKQELTISANAPAETVITISAQNAANNRFVAWGATNLFAETFANEFMTNMTCHNGDTLPTFTEGYDWKKFESIYNGLDAEEQGRLQGAQASEAGSIIQQAMARYDYIEGRYNPDNLSTSAWRNFIGRTVTPIGNGRVMINLLTSQVTNTSIIVIVTAAVSAIAVGGYFFLRKKKED